MVNGIEAAELVRAFWGGFGTGIEAAAPATPGSEATDAARALLFAGGIAANAEQSAEHNTRQCENARQLEPKTAADTQ